MSGGLMPMLDEHRITEEERRVLHDWLVANYVDPQEIPLGTSFRYDGATRTWTFEQMLRGRQGNLFVINGDVMTRYVSLAGATPFPLGG